MTEQEQDVDTVWIRSAPDEQGHYHVAVETDSDTVFPMDATSAYAWAREVLSAVAAAEYDAALVRQMRAMNLNDEDMFVVVNEVRADRAAEVPLSMVAGLTMTPGVSQRTGDGFLVLSVNGARKGQWDMNDARVHALSLMMAIEVAVLDGAYLRAMEKFGIDRNRATQVVDDLGNFRLASEGGKQ